MTCTNEERRKVAKNIRDSVIKGHLFDVDNICDAIGLEVNDWRAWFRLNELIEPEPERTCRLIKRIEYLEDDVFGEVQKISYECSTCGTANRKDAKYCDECGDKVTEVVENG